MSDSTDHLVSGLVADLEPVRPVVRLRSAFAVVLGVAAVLAAATLIPQTGPMGAARLFADATYFVTCMGLLAAAVGGSIAAIAGGRPGRDALESVGRWISGLGFAVAVLACGLGMARMGLALGASPAGIDGMCFRQSLELAVLPTLVVGFFVVRGWTSAPIRTALVGLVAAGAIGGLLIQLSCSFLQPQHLLLGHLSASVVLGLAGVYPLGVLLRRLHG